MKISIIIPIYNSEILLEKCINSVINQTYKNLEIICINDGSKDKSEQIVKEIQQKDNRIILFNQLNSGVSTARNKGIELATGNKILFLDSDDFFYNEKVIQQYLNFQTFDLVISSYSHITKTKELKFIADDFTAKNRVEIESYLLQKNNILFYATVLGKLFDTKIIKNNNIKFENISYGEDTDFMFKYIFYCRNLKSIENILYTYFLVENSLSRGNVKNSWESFLIYYKSFNKNFKIKSNDPKLFIFCRGVKASLLLEAKNNIDYKEFVILVNTMKKFISDEEITTRYNNNIGIYSNIVLFLINNNNYLLYLLIVIRNKLKI